MTDSLERRWDRVWHGLFVAALAVPTGALLIERGAETATATTAGLALVLALWHVVLWAGRLESRPALIGWWTVAVVLAVALIAREGSYVMVTYALYPLAFVTLEWWGIPVVAVVTLAAVAVSGAADVEALYSTVASTLLALTIALFVTAFARQREELAGALEANRRLQGRLVDHARAAGVLEERSRLAREIHDTVAQDLTSIVTQLEVADQALQGGELTAGQERLATARATARYSLGELRRSVVGLRPEMLDGGSLTDALQRLAERTRRETGLDVTLEARLGPDSISPASETTLLRCAQEALANVRRHSDAEAVTVTVRRDGSVADLTVADDGDGFEPGRATAGTGLAGMAERAAAAGGTLDVQAAPGSGTTVHVRVPA